MRTRLTARSQGVSSFKYNQNNSRSSEALHSSQPVSLINPLSVLKMLSYPTSRNEATSSQSRTIDISKYSYKRKQKQKRQSVGINVNNYHGWTSVHHPIIYQIPRSEPMKQNNSGRNSKLTSEKDHKTLEWMLITM